MRRSRRHPEPVPALPVRAVLLRCCAGGRAKLREDVRHLVASTRQAPEVAEYPELGQITAQAPTASQAGERLWLVYDVPKDE